MPLAISSEPVPLATRPDGTVRVGGTRVTLDTVVAAFREGASAEAIARRYPTLGLADVYSVLGYYLRHREEVGVPARAHRGSGAAAGGDRGPLRTRRGA